MPLDELHRKKLKKNLTVMALLLGFAALVWVISMIKIAQI